jgi:hypothetical protein
MHLFHDFGAARKCSFFTVNHFKTHADWKGERCAGPTLKWDCKNRTCDISVPGCVERALECFKHPSLKWPQCSPHHWTKLRCSAKAQTAEKQGTNCVDAADMK